MTMIVQMRIKRVIAMILLTAAICAIAMIVGSSCTRSVCPAYDKVKSYKDSSSHRYTTESMSIGSMKYKK